MKNEVKVMCWLVKATYKNAWLVKIENKKYVHSPKDFLNVRDENDNSCGTLSA